MHFIMLYMHSIKVKTSLKIKRNKARSREVYSTWEVWSLWDYESGSFEVSNGVVGFQSIQAEAARMACGLKHEPCPSDMAFPREKDNSWTRDLGNFPPTSRCFYLAATRASALLTVSLFSEGIKYILVTLHFFIRWHDRLVVPDVQMWKGRTDSETLQCNPGNAHKLANS